MECAPSPFRKDRHLLRIAVRAADVPDEARRPANLTLVIDTSASMAIGNRIDLARKALRRLVDRLRPDDQVGIVTFGSAAQTVLAPTPVSRRARIVAAIEPISTPGSRPDIEWPRRCSQRIGSSA